MGVRNMQNPDTDDQEGCKKVRLRQRERTVFRRIEDTGKHVNR